MPSTNIAKPRGRPSKYSEELADKICLKVSEGTTLKNIANKFSLHISTLYNWLVQHEYFRHKYAEAREVYSEILFQEILELEQRMLEGDITAAEFKASLDARKWILSKLAPKRFGDKIEVSGTIDIAVELEKRLNIIEHNDE